MRVGVSNGTRQCSVYSSSMPVGSTFYLAVLAAWRDSKAQLACILVDDSLCARSHRSAVASCTRPSLVLKSFLRYVQTSSGWPATPAEMRPPLTFALDQVEPCLADFSTREELKHLDQSVRDRAKEVKELCRRLRLRSALNASS